MRYLVLLNVLLVLTGCMRSPSDDDSCGGWGLWKRRNSRQVHSRDEFMCNHSGYIPLEDDLLPQELSMTCAVAEQADQSPGDPNSPIPGIDQFQDPMTLPELAELFGRIQFPLDSSLIKGQENLQVIRAIANYLKKHNDVYVFIEGHCDARGAEAYNLALGSRRSNSVRNLLISEGVDPEHTFTVSYGKERPLVAGTGEEVWRQNRRAEFKVYFR